MVTLVGIKLVFIGMQIIFSTSEINSEIAQTEIFVAAKMPYFVTSRHSLHQKYACSVDIDLSEQYNGHICLLRDVNERYSSKTPYLCINVWNATWNVKYCV